MKPRKIFVDQRANWSSVRDDNVRTKMVELDTHQQEAIIFMKRANPGLFFIYFHLF